MKPEVFEAIVRGKGYAEFIADARRSLVLRLGAFNSYYARKTDEELNAGISDEEAIEAFAVERWRAEKASPTEEETGMWKLLTKLGCDEGDLEQFGIDEENFLNAYIAEHLDSGVQWNDFWVNPDSKAAYPEFSQPKMDAAYAYLMWKAE